MIRISVDFPQPDGPTRVRNSPSGIDRSMSKGPLGPRRTWRFSAVQRLPTRCSNPPSLGGPGINLFDDVFDAKGAKTGDVLDGDRKAVVAEFDHHCAETQFASHLGVERRTDDEARGRRPYIMHPVAHLFVGAVQVPARDQSDAVLPREPQEDGPFGRRRGPVSDLALLGIGDEQGAVREPGDLSAGRAAHRLRQPIELLLLDGVAAADEHGVQANEPPRADVAVPEVRTEMPAPPGEPFSIDGLVRVPCLADVVVARHGQERDVDLAQQTRAMEHVLFHVRAVDGHVAGMHDEVGLAGGNPGPERLPVVVEVTLGGTEVGVGNLDYADHAAQILVKTREYPAPASKGSAAVATTAGHAGRSLPGRPPA